MPLNKLDSQKLKKIALGFAGVAILATIILGYKYLTDLGECPGYVSAEACKQAYVANTSYGKYVSNGVGLAGISSVAALATWLLLVLFGGSKKTPLTPEQQELKAAEREHAQAVREAERKHRSTVKALDKEVKAAEKSLKAAEGIGKQKLGKFRTVTLYEDHIETPQGTAFFENGSVEASVNIGSNLMIEAPDLSYLSEGKPEQAVKAKDFVAKINSAVAAAPRLKKQGKESVVRATEELDAVRNKRELDVAEADEILAKVKENTARVEMARVMVNKKGAFQES